MSDYSDELLIVTVHYLDGSLCGGVFGKLWTLSGLDIMAYQPYIGIKWTILSPVKKNWRNCSNYQVWNIVTVPINSTCHMVMVDWFYFVEWWS